VLDSRKEELRTKLYAKPQVEECMVKREQLHLDILHTKCEVAMWHHRLSKLHELNLEIKPVFAYEQIGRYNPHTFPLEASISLGSSIGRDISSAAWQSLPPTTRSLSSAGSSRCQPTSTSTSSGVGHLSLAPALTIEAQPSESMSPHRLEHQQQVVSDDDGGAAANGFHGMSSDRSEAAHDSNLRSTHSDKRVVPMAIKPAELEELMLRDSTLAAALLPLQGKESAILTAPPEDTAKLLKPQKKDATYEEKIEPKKRMDATTHERDGEDARDQNMIAWITLRVIYIFLSTLCTTHFRLKSTAIFLE
jgi:hypothetical protein